MQDGGISTRKQKDACFRQQNPKVKVALICGFVGTSFHGSCYQGEKIATIELEIKQALVKSGLCGRACSRKIKGWNSCSRVDAGVHAERWLLTARLLLSQCLHATGASQDDASCNIRSEVLCNKNGHFVCTGRSSGPTASQALTTASRIFIRQLLNKFLPSSVCVFKVCRVPEGFDPVASCCRRVYQYRLPWQLLLPPLTQAPLTSKGGVAMPTLLPEPYSEVRAAALRRLNKTLGKFVTGPPGSVARASLHNFTQVGKLPWLKQRVQRTFKQQRRRGATSVPSEYLPVWEAKQMRQWLKQPPRQDAVQRAPRPSMYARPKAGFDQPVLWSTDVCMSGPTGKQGTGSNSACSGASGTRAGGAIDTGVETGSAMDINTGASVAMDAGAGLGGATKLPRQPTTQPVCWPQWVVDGTQRQVYECSAQEASLQNEEGTHVVITIAAPSFMYNQIRYIVGTGMGVASGAVPEWLVDMALLAYIPDPTSAMALTTTLGGDVHSRQIGDMGRALVLMPLAPAAGLALVDAHYKYFGTLVSHSTSKCLTPDSDLFSSSILGTECARDKKALALPLAGAAGLAHYRSGAAHPVIARRRMKNSMDEANCMQSLIRSTTVSAMRDPRLLATVHENHRRFASSCQCLDVKRMEKFFRDGQCCIGKGSAAK